MKISKLLFLLILPFLKVKEKNGLLYKEAIGFVKPIIKKGTIMTPTNQSNGEREL